MGTFVHALYACCCLAVRFRWSTRISVISAMLFNSFSFWVAFPIIFGLYWLIPSGMKKAKKWYLVIVSYALYMNWKPVFALVLFGVTLLTFSGAILMGGMRNRKVIVCTFALLGLMPLLAFKYYNFLDQNFTELLAACNVNIGLPGLNWAIPIGISFFTFQAVGYLLDVYYGRIKAEKSFTDYMLFVSFFPQVASGPISKADELLPQIKQPKPFVYAQGVTGLKLLLWGMFLKLAVADRLGLYVDQVYANYQHYSGECLLLTTVFYSLQIYADFAGYSFMAMGIAKTLGYDLINNFNRPYFSCSVTDFWRRWHISLSRWLKAYVYIHMGGSRCSKLRNYWNILVTFLVSGIWHGANWTFIVWGAFHGLCQIIEKALGLQKNNSTNCWVMCVRIVVTFVIINTAWIFFRMPTLSDAVSIIARMCTSFGQGEFLTYQLTSLRVVIPVLIFKDVYDEFLPNRFRVLRSSLVRRTCYVILFCLILFLGVLDSSQFIYVNF